MFLPFSLCQTRKFRLYGSAQQMKSQNAEDGQLCMQRLTFLTGFGFCHMCFGPGRRGLCGQSETKPKYHSRLRKTLFSQSVEVVYEWEKAHFNILSSY